MRRSHLNIDVRKPYGILRKVMSLCIFSDLTKISLVCSNMLNGWGLSGECMQDHQFLHKRISEVDDYLLSMSVNQKPLLIS